MEEARKLDPRVVLGALAVVCAAAVIWAATALAGTGSSPSSEPAAGDQAALFVQNGESQDGQDDAAPQPGDCPERDGGSGGDSGSSDAGSADV